MIEGIPQTPRTVRTTAEGDHTSNGSAGQSAPGAASGASAALPAQGDQVTISGGATSDRSGAQRLLDSHAVAQLVGSSNMKSGDSITISTDGKPVLVIKKEGVSGYDHFKHFASDAIRSASVEISNVIGQDPAFAFKEAALAVKAQVFSGVPQDVRAFASQGFLPMIRVVALGLDGKKAVDTFKSPNSTLLDKFVDGTHVLTDVAGLAGAVGGVFPIIGAPIAMGLSVAGLMGDVGAYGYHVMKYFRDRGLPVPPPDPTQSTDPAQPSDPTQPTTPSVPPSSLHVATVVPPAQAGLIARTI